MRDHLFSTNKLSYIRGEKPFIDCILCAIRDKSPEVESLEIFRDDDFIASLNLYPYNPGHLMIFPARHVVNLDELSGAEALKMHTLLVKSISVLTHEFSPTGFNIGFNIGNGSGASISHIHKHIVPRYGNEAGFLDVLSGTRIFVTDPVQVRNSLRARFIASM